MLECSNFLVIALRFKEANGKCTPRHCGSFKQEKLQHFVPLWPLHLNQPLKQPMDGASQFKKEQ